MKKSKKSNTHNRENLIKKIAQQTGYSDDVVKKIYNTLDTVVFDALASATEEEDIKIKLFNGITMTSTFVPSKHQMNNLTGKMIQTACKIKPKVIISRDFKTRMNQKMNLV